MWTPGAGEAVLPRQLGRKLVWTACCLLSLCNVFVCFKALMFITVLNKSVTY